MRTKLLALFLAGAALAGAQTPRPSPANVASGSGGSCAGLLGIITGPCNSTSYNGAQTLPNGSVATTQSPGDASADLSTDAFVAGVVASINPAVSVQAATTGVLSNTPTYSNGTAGFGATLTAGSNGALTVDGYTVLLNDRILVKNQASTFQNGIYTETTLGTGSVPYVLTRATDYDATTNINYTGTIPVLQGSTLLNTGWNGPTNIVTVGTDAITYTQASAGNAGGPPGGNVKAIGNLTSGHLIIGAGGKTIDAQSVGFFSGTATMGTGGISSGTCATAVAVTATGVTTASVIIATPTVDPTGVTGYAPSASGSLFIWAYPTANTVNFKVCNNTSGTITPSALTLNWRAL